MRASPHLHTAADKQPIDIDEVFRRLRRATAGLPKAAMFALRDEGYGSPFELLVAALISARTRDETTVPLCRRLFARARTPAALLALGDAELLALLREATFSEQKARNLKRIAAAVVQQYDGRVPADAEALTGFTGVGPKIAALTLGIAHGVPAIAVDVHVHRVVNRWGYVAAPTPERTAEALAAKLPRRYWIEINERLVPFGKFVCTRLQPKCSTCPLLAMCRQIGVGRHR